MMKCWEKYYITIGDYVLMLACIRVYDIKIITMIVQCWPLQPSAYDCLNTAFIEEIQQKSGVIWCKTFGNTHSMMRNIKLCPVF